MNVGKDLKQFFSGEPPGQRTNAIRWLQKKVMRQALELPHEFDNSGSWEAFRDQMRLDLRATIGVPDFPPLRDSYVRGRVQVGEDVVCERVDVYVDPDYAIPTFVLGPDDDSIERPALVWNPGWPQSKWDPAYLAFAERMAKRGYVVLILDHAPFGETTPNEPKTTSAMSLVMGMGNILGISQLALRAAETMRCGEYLRARPDIDAHRVAVAGLCQGGMDTWLAGGLDDRFCAVAPIASESTFAIHYAEMASYRANGDSSPFPFGILKVCDIEHLHAAVAPRPLLVRANLGDDWWPISGMDDVESFTRRIYELYGAADRMDFRAEVHEHNLTGPFADALEAFLLKFV